MSEAMRGPPGACVVGLGARTPVGLRAYSSAAAVRAGISRIREHPFMRDLSGEPFMVAMDALLDEPDRGSRMVALAESAVDEVLLELPVAATTPVPIFLGLPELSRQFTDRHVSELCERLAAHLAGRCQARVHPITEGNAASIVALQRAAAFIEADPTACCIVGGVDSFIDPDVLEPLDEARRIASTSTRWGFPPGEGAGMLAICGSAFARQHRLKVLAKVAGVATSDEPNRINTKTICLGVGLAEALRGALAGAGGPISLQYCDMNGERYREHEFSYAVLRVPASAFVNAVDYIAPADCWGHSGAATAPLLMILPIACHQRGASPGPWPMIWCGSENGRRGAVVLHLEERNS